MENIDNTEKRSSPLMFNRITTARIASGIGGAGLIIALISLLLQNDVTALVLISAIIGIIGLGTWMILAPADLRALISGRRAVYGSNSILVSVLFTGCIAIVYTLLSGTGIGVDLTSAGYYSLKSDVRPVIANLSAPIQITAFYDRQSLDQLSLDSPILRIFADASPEKVRLVFVDPDEQPTLASQFGLTSKFGIFVSYITPDGKPDLRANRVVQMRGDSANEKWVAEAILQLEARGKFHVVFTTGSSEVNINEDGTGIRDGLVSVGIQADTVDLLNQDIPVDTTALVILSPWRDFTQPEVTKIDRYLAGGGKLLLMANPAYDSRIQFMNKVDSPMADYLWENWGIRPQRDIVFDPASYYTSAYYVRPATINTADSIVMKDASAPVQPLFMLAQSWELNPTPPPNVEIVRLYLTSDQGFGKTNLAEIAKDPDRATRNDTDLFGPLILAAKAENKTNGARIIVIGDSGWVRNDSIQSFDGQYLWTNAVDWLTQYLQRITVNPIASELPLNVTTGELNTAALITLLILPGAVLLAGAVVWWRRTRR